MMAPCELHFWKKDSSAEGTLIMEVCLLTARLLKALSEANGDRKRASNWARLIEARWLPGHRTVDAALLLGAVSFPLGECFDVHGEREKGLS